MAEKQKVAILGGGMASMVAAYELTSTPALCARYEVTVYQFGWRLGGKCASGRNQDFGQRIEEHGLHVWFGFYDNAFRVMRDAYEKLGRDPDAPLATWEDAFKPCDDVVIYECFKGRWRGRNFAVPRNPLTPGDTDELPQFWEVARAMLDYFLKEWGALKLANRQVAEATAPSQIRLPFGARLPFGITPTFGCALPFGIRLPFGIDRLAGDLFASMLRWTHPERAITEALRIAERLSDLELPGDAEPELRLFLWKAIENFKRWLWRRVVEPNLDNNDLRFFFTMFDAGTTMLQGIIEDRLIERGFDVVNDEDLREWLRRHGAQPLTVEQGPFVMALYDMAFAYKNGDIQTPDMAAGTAVQDMLRLFFTYRGAFIWKMQAGMGDTVFTPFYEVLKRRGVRFEFFHWVKKLGLSPDRRFIDTIEVIPQVRLKTGKYDPLVDVNGLGSWPAEPDWDQIVDGDELRVSGVNLEWEPNPLDHEPTVLKRGKDFDFDLAVLGISVAALPPICEELIEDDGNPRFGAMLDNSHTVMTQAFQLWLNRPLHGLGWRFSNNSIMTAYVEPLDTYANMSHLIPRESWPVEARVENIAYFCGVIEDRPGDTQQLANDRARVNAIDYLQRDAQVIWPGSIDRDGNFDWRLLVGDGRQGTQRFRSQFWIANFQPTERYVITPAGSVQHRLGAAEAGYENLFLAGDWVKTGLDAGCVEAAVMAGMQASRAICGVPRVIVGEDQTWLSGPGAAPPRVPATRPSYVNYGGLATCPSPVDCEDATLYSFFLEGDHQRLEALCDRVFSEPSGGELDLRPLGRHVMLSFGNVAKIKPQLEPWCEMGYVSERQVALWVPVVAVRSHEGRPVAISLGWFVPYMWVDNPISLTGGREIYGFNKNWGWIELPLDGEVDGLTLDAYGGNYGGGERAGRHRLIEVNRVSTGPLGRGDDGWEDLGDLAGAVQGVLRGGQSDFVALPELELPDQIYADILSRGRMPQIFLKQFRSVSDGECASQQKITDAGVTVKRISGRPLLGEFQFTLQRLDSHPVARELGLRSQATRLAFEIEMDFVLDDGQVIWERASS